MIILLLFSTLVYTSDYAGDFLLDFSGSARALSMGKAYTTQQNDSAAIYFNPASISTKNEFEISFFYSRLFEFSNFYFLSLSHPIGNYKVLSLSLLNLTSDKIQKMDEKASLSDDYFQDSYNTIYFSFSHKPFKFLSYGINFKFIRHQIDDLLSTGFGFDLGLLSQPMKFLTLGLSFRNIFGPNLKYITYTSKFPFAIRSGFEIKPLNNLILVFDYLLVGKRGEYFVGTEYKPKIKELDSFLRFGFNHNEHTVGLGIKKYNIKFDLAISFNRQLGMNYGINLSFIPFVYKEIVPSWNLKKSKRYYEVALELFNKAKYEEARKYAQESLIYYDAYQPSIELLKKINAEVEKIKEAERKKKLEEQTKELFKQATDELEKDNFDKAKELLEKAKSIDHHTAISLIRAKEKSLLKLADELIHKGEYEKAEIELKKVLTLNPENDEAKKLKEKLMKVLEFLR